MDGLFSRTGLLVGEEGLRRLAAARVAVAGVGGVGSYAAEALTRSGVGRLLLIDDDEVAASNINRQLHATTETVGMPKAEVMARRIRAINPAAQVEARRAVLLPENAAQVLEGEWDYIIDAVDTVSAKLALAELAAARGIPLISCMGAGNKLDPTRFEVADIYDTSVCPLCRVMRRELRRRGIEGLRVVYSTEPPRTPSQPPEPEQSAHPKRQTPGSIAFVPPVAGLIAAGVVVRELAGVI